ncbi:MAG: Hsp33 family molecular chaperone HslO [Clostridia bacterium]
MDIIKKAILFGAKAIVEVLDTKELVQSAIDTHNFSDPVAMAMGEALTVTAFISGNFKSDDNKLTVIINGGGPIGQMTTCGDYGAKVRCYCENPQAMQGEKIDKINEVVGANGKLCVIKDFGLKEPYNGLSELVNGNIDSDFAYYFTVSEQLPSAISLQTIVQDGKCLASGGIVIQPMPNCEEEYLVVLQDIARNFTHIATLLQSQSAEEIINYYFGHFENKILDDTIPEYKCNCSTEKIEKMIIALGENEAKKILEEEGELSVDCQFCNAKYKFGKKELDKLFNE